MRAVSLLIVLTLCTASSSAQTRSARARTSDKQAAAAAYAKSDKEAVDYAKAIDVNALDPSLPSQRLEDWLRSGPPHVDALQWWSDETCDNKAVSDEEFPRCVRIAFGRGGLSGYFLVLIGTRRRGIVGPPRLYEGIGVQEEGLVQSGYTKRLSGLPDLLDQPLVSTPVSELYSNAVKRHPMGIPEGADKAAIWPYLSQRLTQQLETAQACQDDYLRRQPKAGNVERPAWITRDLFSGENDRTSAFFVNTNHKEPLKDGTFAVQLNAVERSVTGKNDFIIAGGIPAYTVKRDWAIIATVVLENNRFVVDDIRIFGENSTDGPSHLLSESFAGCDGSHWIGGHAEKKLVVDQVPPSPSVDWDAVNALRSAADKQEVAFAKALDVHELDPSLPSQRLEDWIKSASPHIDHVDWFAGRCNITEGHDGAMPNPTGGLCAGVWLQRGNARGGFSVGTHRKGGVGLPKVDHLAISDLDHIDLEFGRDPDPGSDRLSDLPRLLDENSAIDVTRNLYDAVVQHHPLGIPQGKAKATITPLLSIRLNQLLQTANACGEDYLHQSSAGSGNPAPAWLNAGLFSGSGALALPGAELVDHKEPQADGSFRVLLWLSHQDSAPSGSPTLWKNWHVIAVVKSEAGRFVVDDIQLFDGLSPNSPSHLLSESFLGCSGSRWVGGDNPFN